jgi:hypothetical protein
MRIKSYDHFVYFCIISIHVHLFYRIILLIILFLVQEKNSITFFRKKSYIIKQYNELKHY